MEVEALPPMKRTSPGLTGIFWLFLLVSRGIWLFVCETLVSVKTY
ncbi:hypothetical protein LEP1GSC195_0429 [Leptospira wolbachii serovar Codice str. CDC]|uniref:Uncharacterized protein n=1 Tax=Leptospira wolbachii serovar Codice str. CDC TaxID=1218599 RepID=R9A8A0_9LEPT|nr:hypothetical protein LEP1GSC195_0429 [Leptospira wolbachii serovar Codice str. CDC]